MTHSTRYLNSYSKYIYIKEPKININHSKTKLVLLSSMSSFEACQGAQKGPIQDFVPRGAKFQYPNGGEMTKSYDPDPSLVHSMPTFSRKPSFQGSFGLLNPNSQQNV